MPGWEIEYYDEGTEQFVALDAWSPEVYEELNGDKYATFYIANSAANRAVVASDKTVAIYFDSSPQFVGVLSACEYNRTKIKCTVYDEVQHLLDVAEPLGATDLAFHESTPTDDLLADVVAGTGISVAECPSTAITCVLDLANRLDVAHFIADVLGKDLWTDSGALTVSIGDRGSLQSLSVFTVSKRGVDRSKKRDKVIVKGVDKDGAAIQGSAGTGTNVGTYRSKTASDTSTLNSLAAKYLAELNTESSGAPIETVISSGSVLEAGDTVAISKPLFALDGSYRIVQITKRETKVSLQLDRLRTPIDKAVADLDKYSELGIFMPGSENPWSLTLQGLMGLYHLIDGDGAAAKDSSEQANDGEITNGYWVDGAIPGTKVLSFDADGNVDCGTVFDPGGTDTFAIGCWFSPETAY